MVVVAELCRALERPVGRSVRVLSAFYLIGCQRIIQQAGIIRHEYRVIRHRHCQPLYNRQLIRLVIAQLKDVAFCLAVSADTADRAVHVGIIVRTCSVQSEKLGQIFNRDLAVRLKGERIFILIRGHVHRFVQIILAHCNAVTAGVVKTITVCHSAVGLLHVDDARFRIADKRAGLLRHLDQLVGNNVVFRVVYINLIDHVHIGVDQHHIVRQLVCNILVAGDNLHVPDFVFVADHNTMVRRRSIGCNQFCQQLNALASSTRLTKQDGRIGDFINACRDIGVRAVLADNLISRVDGNCCSQSHTALVYARFLVRSQVIRRILAEILRIRVILDRSVAQAVRLISIGIAVTVHISLARLVVASFMHKEDLIVRRTDILRTAEHRVAALGYILADIHAGACACPYHAAREYRRSGHKAGNAFFAKLHFLFTLPYNYVKYRLNTHLFYSCHFPPSSVLSLCSWFSTHSRAACLQAFYRPAVAYYYSTCSPVGR